MKKKKLLELLKDVPDNYEIICLFDLADLEFYDEVTIDSRQKKVVLEIKF